MGKRQSEKEEGKTIVRFRDDPTGCDFCGSSKPLVFSYRFRKFICAECTRRIEYGE